jgi:hypothetical protein
VPNARGWLLLYGRGSGKSGQWGAYEADVDHLNTVADLARLVLEKTKVILA